MSKWKNKGGKTVLKNITAPYFSSRPIELLESAAYRVLTRAEHLALSRIEIELRRHAGHANGNLIVTDLQFVAYGIRRHSVAAALRGLEALGIIRMIHGRGGNAEHCCPSRFFLNYLCGAVDAHEQITNAWNRTQTMKPARRIAQIAHQAKDRNKVNYGRRMNKNISRPTKRGVKPPHEMGGETTKFPPHEMGVQATPPKRGVLSKSRVVVGDAADLSSEAPASNGSEAIASNPTDALVEQRRQNARLLQLAAAAMKPSGRAH
jgi:hypothetical protein